ncbi:MAG: class I SAM-dependent methyltransferase [Chloroflexi bacterium]|nr:class I SAM-dependent methyltransferase [Chloroflexota bacterium]MBI1854593.1 class I SAM-dependent methyltransferase [Chloroflexota bacterium]MBI3341199.1 class I SAM-dependent methyltransferase [Chloroflexota bacterium]
MAENFPTFSLLESTRWRDYELLDSGDGLKLERFGQYIFSRPEVQAMWKRALPEKDWSSADGTFQPTAEESGGHWVLKKKIEERWKMSYPLPGTSGVLKFWTMATPGRHLGVFPEVASHWDFMAQAVQRAGRPANVLNLFGYTGLASLAAAAAGAQVTHVDASKKSVGWARENQELSGLSSKPIRWIVDDAQKFVQREGRRGAKYDGIILDPPKFGRGPKGEVWEVYKSLPSLLEDCRAILSDKPLFLIVTVYAVKASAIHVGQALEEIMKKYNGNVESGELVSREKSAGRLLSQAVFARWHLK